MSHKTQQATFDAGINLSLEVIILSVNDDNLWKCGREDIECRKTFNVFS